jgi:hypothetical protein
MLVIKALTVIMDSTTRKGARNVERGFTTERLAVALAASVTYDRYSVPDFS